MNLQNLVDYCEDMGLPSIFDGATVPAPLNLDAVLSAIMIRCGLLTPIYGEPDTFRNLVTQWFFQKQWTFEHIINIIESEYSPIENVFEDRTETTTYGKTDTRTGGYKDTEGGKDERDISNSGTDTTTNTVSAFNSSTYQPDNESKTLHGHKVDDDTTYGRTMEREYKSDKNTSGGKDELSVKRHGNVGTISANALIQEEINLLRHFDAYGFIAELFEKDNMLMVY